MYRLTKETEDRVIEKLELILYAMKEYEKNHKVALAEWLDWQLKDIEYWQWKAYDTHERIALRGICDYIRQVKRGEHPTLYRVEFLKRDSDDCCRYEAESSGQPDSSLDYMKSYCFSNVKTHRIKVNPNNAKQEYMHEIGWKIADEEKRVTGPTEVIRSGPTAVEEELEDEGYTIEDVPRTGPTERKTEKLYEVSFWYSNDVADDLYECEDVLATDEDDAIEVIRSGLKDELGYANFTVDKIKLLYDNP